MSVDVFLPKKLQRHAFAPQLTVYQREVGLNTSGAGHRFTRRRLRQEALLDLIIGQRLDAWPVQTSGRRQRSTLRYRANTDAHRSADLTV